MTRNVMVTLAIQISGTAVWFLFHVLCARVLSVEDFGHVFVSINVVMIGGLIAVTGYDITILRFGSTYWKSQDHSAFWSLLTEARRFLILIGLIVVATFLIAAFFDLETPVTLRYDISAVVALSIVATALMQVQRDALRATGALSSALVGQYIIRTTVPLAIVLAIVFLRMPSLLNILTSYLLALVIAGIWGEWRLRSLRPSHKLVPRRALHLSTAMSVWPGSAAQIVLHRAAVVVIAFTGGLEVAALYLVAERIALLGIFLIEAVIISIGPTIAQADPEQVQNDLTNSSIMLLIAGLIGFALLLGLGWMLLLFFGAEYLSALPVLWCILLGQLSWPTFGPVLLVLNLRGLAGNASATIFAGAILMVLILTLTTTAMQAALVYSGALWSINIVLWLIVRKRLNLVSGAFSINRSALKTFFQTEAAFFNLRQKVLGK